jgi:hypothetical protein
MTLDSNGARAGCVVGDGNTVHTPKLGTIFFANLSWTILAHADDDLSQDSEDQVFAGKPEDPNLNSDFEKEAGEKWLDSNGFDSSICWSLCNIMLVIWRDDGVGLQRGNGKMHV